MNDDKVKLLQLLQIIRVNGNTEYLLRSGYTLSTLSEEISRLKAEQLINVTLEGLSINKQGEALFQKLNRQLGRRGLYKYYNTYSIYKDESFPLDFVYVPDKKARMENNV